MSFSNRSRIALNIAWLLVLLALATWFELPHRGRVLNSKCELVPDDESEMSAKSYGNLVASGYRDLRSRRVTTVPLRGDTEPARIINNVCEQRWYVGKLIERLSDAAAAVIVIDKYFSPDSCDSKDPGTLALVSAVRASSRPIIAAAATHAAETDPKNVCLILSPSFDFGEKVSTLGSASKKPAVYVGTSRLNADVRKVPLFWNVYRSDEAFRNNEEPSDLLVETLPYVASVLADPQLKEEHRLSTVRTAGEHPFTAFIEPNSMAHLEALDLLCSGPNRSEIESRYSVNCAARPTVNSDVIGGRVVVIGEDTPGRDRHLLFGRDVPGMYLQANYIESLLDGHYLRPLGTLWNITMLVAWVVLLYALFWRLNPELALLICVAIGTLIWFGISQLVVWKGLYPDVWPQHLGAITMFLKYADARGHRIIEHYR